MYLTKIAFPGLGIGEFEMSKVAFNLFGKDVYWYGVIICAGIILAVLYALFNAQKAGITKDDVLDLAIALIPSAVICARLFYVLTDSVKQESFMEVIAIWDGGISIIGAIIGGAIAAITVMAIKKKSILMTLDLVARCVIIGQIVGRLGNFVNVEVYGIETSLPWGMYISHLGYAVHPLFLYEMLWNAVGFVILHFMAKGKKFHGQILFSYIAWYGLGRTCLELLRDEEFVLTGYISHKVSLAATVAAVICLAVLTVKYHKSKKLGEQVYEPQFGNAVSDGETTEEEEIAKGEEDGNGN